MVPSTFTVTLLLILAILAAAGAPLLTLYIVGGIAASWQLMVTLAAGVITPEQPVQTEEISDDPTVPLDLDRG